MSTLLFSLYLKIYDLFEIWAFPVIVIIKIIRAVDKESSLSLFYGKTAFYAPQSASHLLAERILKDISVLAFDSDLPIFDQKM